MESTTPEDGDNEQQQEEDQQVSAEEERETEKENGLKQEKENEESVVRGAINTTPNYMGKHRLAAALAQLNHQIQFIQEELDELETLGQSSLVCKELVTAVESTPDALLPEIKGPAIIGWDRWFQGGSRTRKRWI